jgi:hypothetical protein
MPNAPGQAGWALNSAYPDYNTAILVRGTSNDGMTIDGGCCAVNCRNFVSAAQGQLYSFHPGVVNVLRADASVQTVQQSISSGVLGALVTRKGGEAVQY